MARWGNFVAESFLLFGSVWYFFYSWLGTSLRRSPSKKRKKRKITFDCSIWIFYSWWHLLMASLVVTPRMGVPGRILLAIRGGWEEGELLMIQPHTQDEIWEWCNSLSQDPPHTHTLTHTHHLSSQTIAVGPKMLPIIITFPPPGRTANWQTSIRFREMKRIGWDAAKGQILPPQNHDEVARFLHGFHQFLPPLPLICFIWRSFRISLSICKSSRSHRAGRAKGAGWNFGEAAADWVYRVQESSRTHSELLSTDIKINLCHKKGGNPSRGGRGVGFLVEKRWKLFIAMGKFCLFLPFSIAYFSERPCEWVCRCGNFQLIEKVNHQSFRSKWNLSNRFKQHFK